MFSEFRRPPNLILFSTCPIIEIYFYVLLAAQKRQNRGRTSRVATTQQRVCATNTNLGHVAIRVREYNFNDVQSLNHPDTKKSIFSFFDLKGRGRKSHFVKKSHFQP